MKTIRNILAGLMVAGFSVGGLSQIRADDTKTTEPVKTAPAGPVAAKKLTVEQLAEMFETMGYTAKFITEGGSKFLLVEIPHGNRTLKAWITWNEDQSIFFLRGMIDSKPTNEQFDAEILKAMLTQNGLNGVGSLYFQQYSDGTGIILYVRIDNTGLSPVQLRKTLSGFAFSLNSTLDAYTAAAKAAAIAKAKVQAGADPKQPLVP